MFYLISNEIRNVTNFFNFRKAVVCSYLIYIKGKKIFNCMGYLRLEFRIGDIWWFKIIDYGHEGKFICFTNY